MVIVAMAIALAAVLFGNYGGAYRERAACMGQRLLSLGGASIHGGECGGEPATLTAAAESSVATPSAQRVASALPTVCAGGVCRGGHCFAAGTPVLTSSGRVAIEDVHVGDEVVAADPGSGTVAPHKVVRLVATPHRTTVTVVTESDGGTTDAVGVTPDHPFWVDGRGWIAAGVLASGDALLGPDGQRVIVRSIDSRSDDETVFNFEVETAHTYFVGAVPVLVHNDCDAPTAPAFTIADLKDLTGAEKLGVVDYYTRITNGERELLNARLNALRKEPNGAAAIAQTLKERAEREIAERKYDYGSVLSRDVLAERGDLAKQQQLYDATVLDRGLIRDLDGFRGGPGFGGSRLRLRIANAGDAPLVTDRDGLSRRDLLGGRRSLELFPGFPLEEVRPLPPSPRDKLLPAGGSYRLSPPQVLDALATKLAEGTGVRERARTTEPPEGSFWRVPKNLVKGVAWRSPLGGFWSNESLQLEKSPEELHRQELLEEALNKASLFEFESNGAGAVSVRIATDPLAFAALQVIAKPENFALLDVASQKAAGQRSPAADGLLSRGDFEAVANGDYPLELKRAAAVFSDQAQFDKLDVAALGGQKDGLVAKIDVDAYLAQNTPKPAKPLYSIAPQMTTIVVNGERIQVTRWSGIGKEIAEKEADLLTGRITLEDFVKFRVVDVGKRAKASAEESRAQLAKETDLLLAQAEAAPASPIFQRAVTSELKAGLLDKRAAEFANRAWYEKLGVGTWEGVKEIIMIPVGLVELVVYVSDHGNPVIWIRGGRPDGSKLLYQLTAEDISNIPDGIGTAFDDWIKSAQAEPDRAIGQTIGFVATFFIPISKLSKVTRLTEVASTALSKAEKLRVAGRLVEAEAQLARAARATQLLRELAEAKAAANSARALAEQAKLAKLTAELEAAAAKTQGELSKAGKAVTSTEGALAKTEGAVAKTEGTVAKTEGTVATAEGAVAKTERTVTKADALRLIDDSEGVAFGPKNVGHAREHVPLPGQDAKLLAESTQKANNTVFRHPRHAEQVLRDVLQKEQAALDALKPGEVLKGTAVIPETIPAWNSVKGGPASLVDVREVTWMIGKRPDGKLHLLHFSPKLIGAAK